MRLSNRAEVLSFDFLLFLLDFVPTVCTVFNICYDRHFFKHKIAIFFLLILHHNPFTSQSSSFTPIFDKTLRRRHPAAAVILNQTN